MKKMSNKAKTAVYMALIVVAFAVLVIAVVNRNTLGNVFAIIWLFAYAITKLFFVYKLIESAIELNEIEREYMDREKKINKRYYEMQISEKENIQVKEKSNESMDSKR